MEELKNYENPQLIENEDMIESNDGFTGSRGANNYKTILLVTTVIVTIAGLYVAWLYLRSDKDWGYEVEWKFWKSSVLWPILSFIGFFLQFFDWQHTSFREGWLVKDSLGRDKFVENNDIMSFLWGSCLAPLLAHFILIPCMYGALLYYAIIIPLALVNAIIPYLAALLSVSVALLFYNFAKNFEYKSMPYVKLVCMAVFCLILIGVISLPTNANINFGSNGSNDNASVHPSGIGNVIVTANIANLRIGPGTNYDFYTQTDGRKLQVKKGDQIVVIEDLGEWFKILVPNGSGIAYIKKTLCTELESNNLEEETIASNKDSMEIQPNEEEVEGGQVEEESTEITPTNEELGDENTNTTMSSVEEHKDNVNQIP